MASCQRHESHSRLRFNTPSAAPNIKVSNGQVMACQKSGISVIDSQEQPEETEAMQSGASVRRFRGFRFGGLVSKG